MLAKRRLKFDDAEYLTRFIFTIHSAMSDRPDYRIILVDQFSQKLLVAVTFLDTLIERLKDTE